MSGFSAIRPLMKLHPQYIQELVFRSSCTIFSLIAVGFFAGCLRINDDVPVPPSSPVKGRWKDGIPILPLGISILSSIYIVYYTILRRHAPHLAVQLALDVTVLIGLVPTITLSALSSAFLLWTPLPPDVLDVACNQENKFTRPCFPELYRLGSLELAAIIFSCAWGWKVVHKKRRRRHRHHGTKERIFVRLDDPETEKDYLSSYLQIVNEVSYPAVAATKENRF
ncbi:hypothetical protein MGYG_02008 [Nannizzia gypsea CBS 118893]|uniref:Integral membrane protein n=1 Tax=Arthroderma gypseum (strain ATCC MYA-4604 / CBS 118893) TaxID=535722 RepID=E4UP55_ARTGP|nr:hypothetical protein MGYG_02008 [Nannizzia gypsea CBS 118893]EFQ98997.1 hypothetical protein MGYG_02008 [Nannizzia gypsea CBS 118893]